ncbi:MAG: arginine--tRNA ligase, partial [Alphaproteobacteria bacterium]
MTRTANSLNIFKTFQFKLHETLRQLLNDGVLKGELAIERTLFEPPRDESHGDLATNAAMVLAKAASMKPRDLAEILATQFRDWDGVETVEIAGPGFINLRLSNAYWHKFLSGVLDAGTQFGTSTTGNGTKVNVEYVSTNPTGPLHIGHVRGAVIGDVLAAMYEATGYDVTREYYVNDAGTQVDVLARSAHLRYTEALGREIEIPDGMYPGDYLISTGQQLAAEHGDKWLDAPESEWLEPIRAFALEQMLDLIRRDLAAMGISQIYSSERQLVDDGKVQTMLDRLTEQGLIYTGQLPPPKGKPDEDWEPRDQLLFKTTEFGDKVDRALVKSDGTYTYFATDVAYHLDKIERGADV